MPTIGGGDDFVWIGGPDKGLWLLVVVGDEAIDGGLEIDDAFEEAALEAPLAQGQRDDALGDIVGQSGDPRRPRLVA
jgi:hypothetical protein